eukprot:6470792-Amphidinium_carterae.1
MSCMTSGKVFSHATLGLQEFPRGHAIHATFGLLGHATHATIIFVTKQNIKSNKQMMGGAENQPGRIDLQDWRLRAIRSTN